MAKKDNDPPLFSCGALAIFFGLTGFLMALFNEGYGINMSVTGHYGAGEFGMTSLVMVFVGVVMLICGGVSRISERQDDKAAEKKRKNDIKKRLSDLELVENTNDESVLIEIARYNPTVSVRLNAVRKINNDDALKIIALNDSSKLVRDAAIDRITDESVLKSIVAYFPTDRSVLPPPSELELIASVQEKAIKRLAELYGSDDASKICPNCKKRVPINAIRCKYCKTMFDDK